jgi:predicted AAA+ superfamily ATPase
VQGTHNPLVVGSNPTGPSYSLLKSLRGYSIARSRAERSLFGALLESFVFLGLLKLSAWADERVSLFYYRDRDKFIVLYDGAQTSGYR